MCWCWCWCWCWWRVGVVGAVGLWFLEAFYGFAHGWMASRGAQFGCATRLALAAAGESVHDRAPVRVTAHASCGRLSAACGGCLKVKDRASGGACAASGLAPGSGGPRSQAADAACGRVRPGFPIASSPYGTRPVWRCPAASQLLWPASVRLDTAKPARLAAPADATGTRDNPACGMDPRTSRSMAHRRLCARVDLVHTTGGGCPGSLVAVGGLCQSGRTARSGS